MFAIALLTLFLAYVTQGPDRHGHLFIVAGATLLIGLPAGVVIALLWIVPSRRP